MKQGLEGRLRKLESKYAAELDPEVISIGWLEDEDRQQGKLPGLYYYELPPEEGDSSVAAPSVET